MFRQDAGGAGSVTITELHEPSNSRLLAKLPADQLERVLAADMCDIDESFLGFVGIYERLAQIIPNHWTVIDLGCAYAPQALFFERHKKYIGVDVMTPIASRFSGSNSIHLEMTIGDFIENRLAEFDQNTTFAVCSYVPPWHGDNSDLARKSFKNVFTYYPAGEISKIPKTSQAS
jgi:hypothetical protein